MAHPASADPRHLGKSHLAQAIGRAAIHQGYPVLYREAHTFLEELAVPGGLSKEHVFALGDEARGRELVDEGPIHLPVEGEVEGLERAVRVAEPGLLVPAGEQAVVAPLELVGDERGDEIDRRERFGLGVVQARFEDIGHPGEAQFPQRLIEFDEIHTGSPFCDR